MARQTRLYASEGTRQEHASRPPAQAGLFACAGRASNGFLASPGSKAGPAAQKERPTP
jgi:hypothetical protein